MEDLNFWSRMITSDLEMYSESDSGWVECNNDFLVRDSVQYGKHNSGELRTRSKNSIDR